MMSHNPHIAVLLERLYHPGLARIDFHLDRMQRFLDALGNPEKRLPPVIHVAGTNGKGSLIANLYGIFQAAGYTPHRYISPHLKTFNERIVVAGKEIDDAYLSVLLERIVKILEQTPVTFFEATTALAFLAFAEHEADVVLLETGMGGRLDATNVIAKPALTVITPIAMDHCEYLGKSITAIAGEKAGILKAGVPCVVGRQEADAMRAIQARAENLAVPLYRLGMDWQWQSKGNHAVYSSRTRTIPFSPALIGRHQYDNAAAAIACIDQLPQFSISDAQVQAGIATTQWQGRLEPITQGGYRDVLPSYLELWLDGGHNPQGGAILAAWLLEQHKDVYLVCGMIKGKDTLGYLQTLSSVTKELYAIAIPDEEDTQSAEDIKKSAMLADIAAIEMPSIGNALQLIAKRAKKPGIVCICGSLYLAGAVLSKQNEVLDNAV